MSEQKRFEANKYHTAFVSLSDALRRRKLILVLGAGISVPAGLPSWDELVMPLRRDLGLPEPGPETDSRLTDPLVIAEMHEQEFGRPVTRSKLVRQMRHVNEPTAVHRALAKLNVPSIFTTNWDPLIERALEEVGRQFFLVSRDSDYSYQVADDALVLVKLHGDMNSPSDIIVTKSDVLDYHRTHPNVLSAFKDRLRTHTALLVGVSLKDPNLEGIIEQALRDVKGHEPRHFVLIKAWPDSLARYYRLHSLRTISLDDWEHIVPFINELVKRAGQIPAVEKGMLRSTTPTSLNLSVEALEEVLEDAARALEKEYKALLELYREGRRASIRTPAEDLCKRLRRRKERPFRSLTAKVLLLLAQIALQSPPTPDRKRAQECLDEAEKLVDESLAEQYKVVAAMLDYFRGDANSALEKLGPLSGDGALKLRLGVLMERKEFNACEGIIQATGKETGVDEGWDQLLAEFHMRREEYNSAISVIKPWVDQDDASALSLQLAGSILAQKASEEHRRFCDRHNLFRQFSLVLNLGQLVDCNDASAAASYFEKASRLFENSGERYHASECAAQAYELLSICAGTGSDHSQMAERAVRLSALDASVQGESLADPARVTDMSLVEIRTALEQTEHLQYVLGKLKEWARYESNRAAEAARLLENDEIRQKFQLVEEQAWLVTCAAGLWTDAGDFESALRVIDSFVPPVEYTYFLDVLRAIQYLNQEDEEGAAKVIQALEQEFAGNPIVLALLCEWYERREDWQRMLSLSEDLLSLIETPQTFDYYLTALGRLEKWGRTLEGLDRAASLGVRLAPGWTVLNRARALVGMEREQEAIALYEKGLALEEQGEVTLRPSDLLNLMVAYVITGDRQKALETVRVVVHRFPKNRDGHVKLVQLLMEEHRHDEAFKAAKYALEILPDDDRICATHIETGLLTGHGEEVAEALREFPRRFPYSQAMQMVPQEEGFRLYKEAVEHAAWSEQQYRDGKASVIQSVYMSSSMPSYYRFWHASTRTRSGLYIACGDQGSEWESLEPDDLGFLGSAVVDFPALITAFELNEEFRTWLGSLKNTFRRLYVPQSFRRILAAERSSLSGNVQIERYDSLRRLRNIIDSRLNQFPQIPISSELKDHMGHETERTFAQKRQLPYLNEYSKEPERIEMEIGFFEIEAFFSSVAEITPVQEKKIRGLARERRPRPSAEIPKGQREIVADMTTLHSLTEIGLMEPFLKHFEKIHISELGWQWLLSEIASSDFAEDLVRRFKKFERFLEDLGEWLQWVPVEQGDRDEVWDDKKDTIRKSDHLGVMSYLLDLHILAAEKGCALITDDRASKIVRFTASPSTIDLNKPQRLGSDTLLRYYHQSGKIDLNDFFSIYAKLIEWNFRHLPIEPEFILGKLPAQGSSLPKGLADVLGYYRESLTEFVALAKRNPSTWTPDPLRTVMASNKDALAEVLTQMFLRGNEAQVGGLLIKEMAWTRLLDDYRFRAAEYLRSLIACLMVRSSRPLPEHYENREGEYWSWIDTALTVSGFEQTDIDAAWIGTIHNMINQGVARMADKHLGQASIAWLLETLPARTRESILTSYLAKRFRDEFGWKIHEAGGYSWAVDSENGGEEITITANQAVAALRASVKALSEGITEQVIDGIRVTWSQQYPHSFVVEVRFMPAHPALEPSEAPSVPIVFSVLKWFFDEDKRLREEAWKRGKNKLDQYGSETARWTSLRSFLLSGSRQEVHDRASECIDVLLSIADVAADLITESVKGDLEIRRDVISFLKPDHVSKWLGADAVNWESADDLIDHAKSTCQRLRFHHEQGWRKLRSLAFQSLFPDAEVFRGSQVKSLQDLSASRKRKESLVEFALELVEEAEAFSSPAYKINVVLTLLQLAGGPGVDVSSFWKSSSENRRTEPLQRRAQQLLRQALFTPKLPGQETDIGSEMLAVGAQWSSALFSIWSCKSDGNVYRNRYLSCIAGGFLACKLRETGVLGEKADWGLFRRHLFDLEERYAFFDGEPGFYRPGLARYLSYPAAYLVNGLSPYLEQLKSHLLGESLERRLLQVPLYHRLFYRIVGGEKGLDRCWLDRSFDTTENAGIDRMLIECLGDSLDFWDERDREMLGSLSQPVDIERFIQKNFEAIPSIPEEKLEGHCFVLFHMVWLAFVFNGPEWKRWMECWFDTDVLSRISETATFYSFFAMNLGQSLLVGHMQGNNKETIESLLFCPPEDTARQEQVMAHSVAIQFLVKNQKYTDRLEPWLTTVSLSELLSPETRRGIIRSWTDLFDGLPGEVQPKLKRILQQLAKQPFYWNMTELLRFVEADHNVR